MKRSLLLLLVACLVSLAFVACGSDEGGEEDEEGTLTECTDEAPAESVPEGLPADFPAPDETVYTGGAEAGPSFVAEAYFEGGLPEAFEAYEQSFEDAGYDITKDEQEERDAEVFFAGNGTTGQVNMFAECEGRTKLRITIRPD